MEKTTKLNAIPSHVRSSSLLSVAKVVGVIILGGFILGGLLTFGARYIRYDEANKKFTIGDDVVIEGNVGIGTTGPRHRLDVNGNFQATDIYTTDGVQIQGLSGRNYFRDAEGAGNLRVGAAWGMPGVYAESGVGVLGGASGASLQNNSLFVATNGNVGIGTTGPGAKLEVVGNVKANDLIFDNKSLKNCQFCRHVKPSDVRGQCDNWGTYCAPIDSWTHSYGDDTDGRSGGCWMSWKIDCTPPYGD